MNNAETTGRILCTPATIRVFYGCGENTLHSSDYKSILRMWREYSIVIVIDTENPPYSNYMVVEEKKL